MSLSDIGQIAITVTDLDRAVAFYRDTLGLPFLFQYPGLAFFQCGAVRLMLSPGEGERFSSAVYYKVPDIHASSAELASKGVAFERDPHLIARLPDHELWMAFFRDPDHNLLALMSEVRN